MSELERAFLTFFPQFHKYNCNLITSVTKPSRQLRQSCVLVCFLFFLLFRAARRFVTLVTHENLRNRVALNGNRFATRCATGSFSNVTRSLQFTCPANRATRLGSPKPESLSTGAQKFSRYRQFVARRQRANLAKIARWKSSMR